MAQQTLESLALQAAAGDRTASDDFLARLQALLRPLDEGMLDKVASCALALKGERQGEAVSPARPGEAPAAGPNLADLPTGVVALTPELLEWARQEVTDEEVLAGLRDVEANGGLGSEELLSVLEAEGERP
ncbi:MAG TPA: hypothetical protein VFW33_08160 [Gemmataceae bacterium]|nr:hypothetical protein [Gemmataceae bacterium]